MCCLFIAFGAKYHLLGGLFFPAHVATELHSHVCWPAYPLYILWKFILFAMLQLCEPCFLRGMYSCGHLTTFSPLLVCRGTRKRRSNTCTGVWPRRTIKLVVVYEPNCMAQLLTPPSLQVDGSTIDRTQLFPVEGFGLEIALCWQGRRQPTKL